MNASDSLSMPLSPPLSVESWQEKNKRLLDTHLEKCIETTSETPYALLFSAARYSLLAPAKRIRPLLLFAILDAYGVAPAQGLDTACALEMIHTYSLIHDDLPCMDDDDFRRGRPTLHKVFGEAHALLVGDYLLTYAFEILASSPCLTEKQKIALICTFSKKAGAHGMIGGQVIDLASENQCINPSILEQMHECKTAQLIIAALIGGAIISEAPSIDHSLLESMGRKMGIAFQIADDLLDVTSSFEEMGKSNGADAKKSKATAVSILGIEKSKEILESLYTTTQSELNQLSCPAPYLSALFHQLIHRNK